MKAKYMYIYSIFIIAAIWALYMLTPICKAVKESDLETDKYLVVEIINATDADLIVLKSVGFEGQVTTGEGILEDGYFTNNVVKGNENHIMFNKLIITGHFKNKPPTELSKCKTFYIKDIYAQYPAKRKNLILKAILPKDRAFRIDRWVY